MDFMAGLHDDAFDLAIVDPPYGIYHGHQKTGFFRTRSWEKNSKAVEWDVRPEPEYFEELQRVSKNQIIWGGNYFFEYLGNCKALIIWDKQNGDSNFADGECAWSSFKDFGTLRIFRHQWAGCFRSSERREKHFHPTQKPVALYRWLLQNYAKPGQTIFDSHVGSGSIRLACHELGYSFEGCEIDPEYHAAQEDR
jgi:site-specific DNA-methyltransferase (adenine-specific)